MYACRASAQMDVGVGAVMVSHAIVWRADPTTAGRSFRGTLSPSIITPVVALLSRRAFILCSSLSHTHSLSTFVYACVVAYVQIG